MERVSDAQATMAWMATKRRSSTANQPPPLSDYNLFEQDAALVEALRREGGAPWEEQVAAFGELLGGEPLEWGRLANEHPPQLRTHDRYGERIDEVEFHPAWDSLLRLGLERSSTRCRGSTPPPARTSRGQRSSCCSARSRQVSAARSR